MTGQDGAAVTDAARTKVPLRRTARAPEATGSTMGEHGEAGTRSRIQDIALELFTEQGYESTSLREIAERLGVTKAALYYHFKTKDDIIASLVDERVAKIDELIDWLEAQPRSAQTRLEFVHRYAELLHEGGRHRLMRFFERNQTVMHSLKSGGVLRERMIRMLNVLSDPHAPLVERLRRSLAIFALHSTWFVLRDPEVTDDQRRDAALEVALDLIK